MMSLVTEPFDLAYSVSYMSSLETKLVSCLVFIKYFASKIMTS